MKRKDIVRFTMRIPNEFLKKLGYIASYYGRTKNKELEQIVKARINSFEQKYGEIKVEDEE